MGSNPENWLRVYLAGPDVFLPDPIAQARRKKEICRRFGFEGVFPLDVTLDLAGLTPATAGLKISAANEDLIRGCHLVVANMTPFRGPSTDVGTAYEMGFARALGLRVYGYSNTAMLFLDRTMATLDSPTMRDTDGRVRDADGMSLEEFNLIDNLMLDGCVHSSGGALVVRESAAAERYTDLAAFEECLRYARNGGDSSR